MKIYGIKNCDKIRATIKWCQSNNKTCQLHDYRVDGIDSQLLDSFLSQHSLDALINKRSTTWRKLSADEKSNLSIDIILNNPTLLKRPIVDIDGSYHIGYFPEKWH
jgi:Spx/MgsR family transcriptional regulator